MSVARKKRRESIAGTGANPPQPNSGRRRKMAWYALAGSVICVAALALSGRLVPLHLGLSKLVIGTKDRVYYSPPITAGVAQAVGKELQSVGYFTDRGADATLSKGAGGTVASFASNQGWNDRNTIMAFEEIGRRIAVPLGGYPIQVHLVDKWGKVHRAIAVGKVAETGQDQIYYFGAATDAQADALAKVLSSGGFIRGLGSIVSLSKEDRTTLSFVVYGDSWKRPEALAAMETMTRQAAPSIGGLPITLRLLDTSMAPLREVLVQ